MAQKADPAQRDSQSREPKSAVATALKWAGSITAILSLVFALQRLTQMMSENRERQRTATELYQVGKRQQSSRDYEGAWKSFEAGSKAAQEGGTFAKLTGQLSKEQRQFREAQEDLAMEWLENIRINPDKGETFTAVIAPLTPVLTRGTTSSSGARKADLLAHIGWSNYLRGREASEVDPEPQYKEALDTDSLNPYAHAFLAHWKLGTDHAAALPEAREHFTAALRSGRERAVVRRMQVAALTNLGTEGEPDLLRTVADMRKSNDSIDARTRSRVYATYWFVCHRLWDGFSRDTARFGLIHSAIPMAEHDSILQTLFTDFDRGRARERDACRAILHEASGQRQEAIKIWTALRQTESADRVWREYADAALKRLSSARE